jgi:hypothetical protein
MCDASPGARVLRASNGEPLSLARAAVAGEQRRGVIEADGEVPLDLRAGVLGDHRGALGRRPCRARPRALIRSASRLGHDVDRFTDDLQTHRWQDRIDALLETADLSGVSARRASWPTASGSEACTTWPRSVAPFAAHIPAPPSCALPGGPGSGSADGSYGNVVVTTLGQSRSMDPSTDSVDTRGFLLVQAALDHRDDRRPESRHRGTERSISVIGVAAVAPRPMMPSSRYLRSASAVVDHQPVEAQGSYTSDATSGASSPQMSGCSTSTSTGTEETQGQRPPPPAAVPWRTLQSAHDVESHGT